MARKRSRSTEGKSHVVCVRCITRRGKRICKSGRAKPSRFCFTSTRKRSQREKK